MLRRLAVPMGLALALAGSAAAQPSYGQKSVSIRAGILLIESQQTGGRLDNFTPHVFYNLDHAEFVKPAGWTFQNPRASTQVSQAIAARWGAGGAVLAEPIHKRNAAHWEVPLSAVGDNELMDYDILLLSAYRIVQLNPLERDRLRRFVDQGGLLWVDLGGTTGIDTANNLPIPIGLNTTGAGVNRTADRFHPLLSFPNEISDVNLFEMESSSVFGVRPLTQADFGGGGLEPILSPLRPDSFKMQPVVSDGAGAVVSVGRIGDGFVVVTARGVANTLNRTYVNGVVAPNQDYMALTAPQNREATAAARLVINMVNLSTRNDSVGAGSRKTSSYAVDVSAPLLKRFKVPTSGPANPPVVYKGMAIMTVGSQIVVMDMDPQNDLDADGNPDDGLPDLSLGANFDVIWSSQNLPAPVSAPAVTEVANASGVPTDQILVTDGNGALWAFDVFGTGAGYPSAVSAAYGPLLPPNGAASFDGTPGSGPFAPTVHEGMAFVGDAQVQGLQRVGRVWVVDLSRGQLVTSAQGFVVGGTGVGFQNIGEVGSSPTVGYVPVADNSGALDRVAYVATRPIPGSSAPNSAAGISSLWIGVRGERHEPVYETGSLVVTTRASLNGLRVFKPSAEPHPLGVKLTVVNGLTGAPLTAAQMGTYFTGGYTETAGVLRFGLNGGNPLPADHYIRVDYSIDWGTGQAGITQQIQRGFLYFPDDGTRRRRVLGNVGLSPTGVIFTVVGAGDELSGNSLFAIREEGRGTFKLHYRYDLYPQHTFNLSQAGTAGSPTATYRETLVDQDGLTRLIPFLGGRLTRLSFQSGPAIRNGNVYVMARGYKQLFGFGIPMSILMAFKAEPETAEIKLPDAGGSFTIAQPDIARSGNKGAPDVVNTLGPANYTYIAGQDRTPGVVKIENMMSATRGVMQNALSTSQPVIIRRSGQPDRLVEPDRNGGVWSPLQWYMVLHGLENNSAPFVTGGTLFLAGQSALPTALRTNWAQFLPFTGMLYGIDAVISPNNAFLQSISETNPQTGATEPNLPGGRPWLRQLSQLKFTGAASFPYEGNPAVRWPQGRGVRSGDDWRLRVLQTTLDTDSVALGVVAGESSVFAWSNENLYAFSRADVIVADEGRIGRFDPSGNPIWISNTTLNAGGSVDTTAVGNAKPLVRPTRAYPSGTGLLVVDTGADRVIRLDYTGKEIRSIDGFRLDPNTKPDGYKGNDPVTLRQPRDVVRYTSYVPAAQNRLSSPAPVEYWVHHLIADSGNRRLVELVDRYVYDPATKQVGDVVSLNIGGNAVPQYGVLYWHSPSELSGRSFSYNSLSRLLADAGAGPVYVYAAGIGGSLPTTVGLGLDTPSANQLNESSSGNGGIVVFSSTGATTVINEVTLPAIGAGVVWNDSLGGFDPTGFPSRQKALGGLNSVSMRVVDVGGTSRIAVMFTDSTGVYEVYQPAATNSTQIVPNSPWVVRYMVPRTAFTALRRNSSDVPIPAENPRDFRPTFARRLDSGEVLIVNGYMGFKRDGSRYTGEIVQLNGEVFGAGNPEGFSFTLPNFNLSALSVRFELPPVQGAREIVLPVFADRR